MDVHASEHEKYVVTSTNESLIWRKIVVLTYVLIVLRGYAPDELMVVSSGDILIPTW